MIHILDACLGESHERNREQHRRYRHEAIHYAHDDGIGDTVEAGDEPEGEADDGAEDGHAQAHFERDAGAIERAAIEVAAIGIRAEPVCR